MRARDLNKQIEIFNTGTKASDGFGGSTVSVPVSEGTFYAKIETIDDGAIQKEYGGSIPMRSVKVTVRAYVDITPQNHYFVYRNEKYIVNGALINEDFEDRFKTFTASVNKR